MFGAKCDKNLMTCRSRILESWHPGNKDLKGQKGFTEIFWSFDFLNRFEIIYQI